MQKRRTKVRASGSTSTRRRGGVRMVVSLLAGAQRVKRAEVARPLDIGTPAIKLLHFIGKEQ
jgi:hypothetical protein